MDNKLLWALIDAKTMELNCLAKHFHIKDISLIYNLNILHGMCKKLKPNKENILKEKQTFEKLEDELIINTELLQIPWIFHQKLSEFQSLINTFYFQL